MDGESHETVRHERQVFWWFVLIHIGFFTPVGAWLMREYQVTICVPQMS